MYFSLLGVEKFTISRSLPYRCYIPNLVKIAPVVFEKILTRYDGCQPIAKGHLSDLCYFI